MKMKIIALLFITGLLTGCASGSPVDFLIPTKKSPVAKEYLGHLNLTNDVNHVYHSLSDTKLENQLIEIRKLELQGLYLVNKKYNELMVQTAEPFSNALWIGITMLLTSAGIMVPRPQEKAKVIEALHKEPPHKNKQDS